jgi:hypothetical protein
MSRISTIGSFLLSIPLVASPFAPTPIVQAQQVSITARVPFEFQANNQHLAAGIYQIKLISDRFLLFYNTNTGKSQFVMVSPAWVDVVQSQGRLVFHNYDGRRHYLFQVRIPGRSGYSELVPTRSERQIMLAARLNSSPGNVEEALATPAR